MKKIIALVLVVVFAIFGGIFAVTHIKVIDAGKVELFTLQMVELRMRYIVRDGTLFRRCIK